MQSSFTLRLTTISLILTPLFFWTLTPNFLATPKEIIISLLAILLCTSLAYSTLTQKKLHLPKLADSLPLLIFIFAIIGSLLANPEGRPEALASKGLALLCLPLISIVLISHQQSRHTHIYSASIMGVGLILSLHSLLSLTFLSRSPYLPEFMQNQSFTLTGNYITTLTLIALSIALAVGTLRHTSFFKYLSLATLALGSIATVAIISLMLPGGTLSPIAITYTNAWSIALDALKSLRSLLFGIGISNYSVLYSAVKPLSINATSLWSSLPTSSPSELLTLLPTAGILSTLAFVHLILLSLKRSYKTPYFSAILILTLAFAATPATSSTYLMFFVFYALLSRPSSSSELSSPIFYVTSFLYLALALLIAFPAGRMLLSEYSLRQAQRFLNSGDSHKVYTSHLQAIRFSPRIANYHLSFADFNFRIASALSQREELTDQDRETITTLIQQSIQSAKIAITLRPNDSRTWILIAKIYQNLVNVAQGSESFALEAYGRAIALDRANPALRVDFANLLATLSDSQSEASQAANLKNRALSELQIAIQLKNDYTNAFYNLAGILEKAGDINGATTALEQTLRYLDPNSQDYDLVNAELETLKNKKTPTPLPPSTQTELSTFSPLPSPIPGGLLEIN